MIYSKWNPSTGGYSYYEGTGLDVGIGNDLPKPRLPGGRGGLGVPSTEAGRPMPPGAKKIGEGTFARGVIAPLDRSPIRGLGTMDVDTKWIFAAVAVAGVLWWSSKR